jgi:hypothetical protein
MPPVRMDVKIATLLFRIEICRKKRLRQGGARVEDFQVSSSVIKVVGETGPDRVRCRVRSDFRGLLTSAL